jgi:hypothetical protein
MSYTVKTLGEATVENLPFEEAQKLGVAAFKRGKKVSLYNGDKKCRSWNTEKVEANAQLEQSKSKKSV